MAQADNNPMEVIGFSRKGFLYLEEQTYLYVFTVQVNQSESFMLDNFSSLPEFDTLDEAKTYIDKLFAEEGA